MALTIGDASHIDHGLTEEQLHWLLEKYKDRDGFFIDTTTLPAERGTLQCGLHGPAVGDEPVAEEEVRYECRPGRNWPSRICDRPQRSTSTVTIIAGPVGEHRCLLYTVYGGPAAPREALDPYIESEEERDASEAFWAVHALSAT